MLEGRVSALTRWLSWLERCPIHQKFEDSIPGQGTYLGCGFHPWSSANGSNQSMFLSLIDVLLSLFFSLSLTEIKKNISSGED